MASRASDDSPHSIPVRIPTGSMPMRVFAVFRRTAPPPAFRCAAILMLAYTEIPMRHTKTDGKVLAEVPSLRKATLP
jgi:hypothetical protein